MQEQDKVGKLEGGFTLIELLIAIVVVGILTAVAIVGIGGLVDNGGTAACQASLDASKAAAAVHFANTNGAYPSTFGAMKFTSPPELETASGVNGAGTELTHGPAASPDWTLTMTGGAAVPNTFACT